MHYIDNTAIMQVESNTKLKRNKWTSKRFHLIRKHICTQHTHEHTNTHVYTYRAWKWTNNHQRPKMKIKDKKAERQQHQNGICINSMKYKYTQISFTRLVQRQWFLCKWMLVDWFSSARSLALSLCNSCAYGTRAAFHSMLFIFAPVKSFASSFLHFIFKLFYVVGGFSVFRYGANNINVCGYAHRVFGLGVFRRNFICASHRIASHRMVHVWCVSVCLFLFSAIALTISFIHRQHS